MLSSAISQKKRIQFRYQPEKGQQKIRKVDPYILVFYKDHWNMIGFSHLRGDFRNFILEKMEEVEILPEDFSRKNKMNTEALIFRSEDRSFLIELSIDNSVVRRFESHLPAKNFREIDKNSEKTKIEFEFENLDYINQWLLQFGEQVRVLAPSDLTALRKRTLQKMLDDSGE